MFKHLISIAILALVLIPIGLPGSILVFTESSLLRMMIIILFPMISLSLYTLICIGFAQLGRRAIIPGKFPRSLDHAVYSRRRLYGTMWTAIYYNKPLYWLLLSHGFTKKVLLRGFGYKGSLDIVTYPDTWIRDLPLLELKEGAYLANKATLGTNMCLSDGTIVVDTIRVGTKSVIGHLSMLAPGIRIGDYCETGAGSILGMRCIIGNNVNIGPGAFLNHGVEIADGVTVGNSASLGLKVKILAKGLTIPAFAVIPGRTVIHSKEDLDMILHGQAGMPQSIGIEIRRVGESEAIKNVHK